MSTRKVHERIAQSGGKISSVEYDFHESHGTGSGVQTIKISRENYEQLAATKSTRTLAFDEFAKVLKAFMKGSHAKPDEISEAFHVLDNNHSGHINLIELSAFVPIIAPNYTSQMLLSHVTKVDKNNDYRMDFAEFTDFVKKNVGRQLALGRV